jgi:ABC-type multidrug transport system ATPase subunit
MATLESPAAGPVEAPAALGGRPAVEVAHLRKAYGTLVAVDDVSFTVTEGEIFGILGPNGAGKTTAIECAIGLRRPDAGTIRLLGLDPQARRDTWELIEHIRDRGVTIVLVTHF